MYCSIEWLNSELEKCPDKRSRRELIVEFLTVASDFLSGECMQLATEVYEDALKDNDRDMIAYSLLYVSFAHKVKGEQQPAEEAFNKVLDMLDQLTPGFSSMIIFQMIAFEYWSSGKRDLAFEYAFRSQKQCTSLRNKEGLGWAHFQLGVFYFDLKDYESSMKYFRMSEEEAIGSGMDYQLARTFSGIGSIHIAKGDLDQGLEYNKKALDGYRAVGHETAISRALNDIGVICTRREQYTEAEKYLSEALSIRTRLNYAPGVITTQMEMARLMKALGRDSEEQQYLSEALSLSELTNSKQKAIACHLMLSELYKKKKDAWKALDHVESYNRLKADLAGEETSNRIQHLQQKFATEKSEQEAEIHRLKNVELKQLNDEIAEKNKSILDSIHYAKRIQESLLPSEKYIERVLREMNGY